MPEDWEGGPGAHSALGQAFFSPPAAPPSRAPCPGCQSGEASFFSGLRLFPAFPLNWGAGPPPSLRQPPPRVALRGWHTGSQRMGSWKPPPSLPSSLCPGLGAAPAAPSLGASCPCPTRLGGGCSPALPHSLFSTQLWMLRSRSVGAKQCRDRGLGSQTPGLGGGGAAAQAPGREGSLRGENLRLYIHPLDTPSSPGLSASSQDRPSEARLERGAQAGVLCPLLPTPTPARTKPKLLCCPTRTPLFPWAPPQPNPTPFTEQGPSRKPAGTQPP